jgi:DNA-binding NarL/FixJ family response regulator
MQPIRTNQYLLPQFYQPRTKEKLSAGASPVLVLPAISQQQNYRGWRTRSIPIRTTSEISAHIKILPVVRIPLYQKLAKKVQELVALGMSLRAIAKILKVSKKTITNAYQYKG